MSHLTAAPLNPLAAVIARRVQATFLLDEGGDVVYASDGVTAVLGCRQDDLLGRPFATVVTPADRPRVARLLAFVGTGPERTAEGVTLAHADRSLVAADLVADRLEADNGGRGALVTVRVSGLLAAVRRADTGTLAPVTVFALDARGACAAISDRWTRVTGQPCVDALGVGWLRCVHPDDRRELRSVAAAAHAQRAPFRHRFRLQTAAGEYEDVEVAVEPRRDDGAVGVVVPAPSSASESPRGALTTHAVVHLDGDDITIELVDTPSF